MEGFFLRIQRRTESGEIASFAVVLFADIQDEWVNISRYDTAHGYPHRDVLGKREGLRGKLRMTKKKEKHSAMRSVTLQKTQKTTLKTSSPIKRTMKPTRDIFTVKQCDAILREFGARPSTAEQTQIFSEAEARSKAKHSKRLVAA